MPIPKNINPSKQYRIKLSKPAMLFGAILRIKDDHVISGAALSQIQPQDAVIEAAEVVPPYTP